MEHARPPSELSLEGGPAARSEAWRKWYRQFTVFVKASGVHKEPSDVQTSLLVNLIGSEGYDVYSTFKFESGEDKEDLPTIVKKFNSHFGTKQNTTMARFKFFTRQQEIGESIDEYITALKLLSQLCEFEHLEESLIRDRIVCGVGDGKVRDRLLRADDLTLAQAVKICQASEMSIEEKRQIEETKTNNKDGPIAVDAVYSSRGLAAAAGDSRARGWQARAQRGSASGRTARGGGRGGARAGFRGFSASSRCGACANARCNGDAQCPAKHVTCFQCGEVGHYRRMCTKNNSRKVYQIAGDSSGCNDSYSEEELYYVSTVDGVCRSKDSKKWYETLILSTNGRQMNFKLDTGSDLNVMSENNFVKLGFNVNCLKPDNTKAQSFCGNLIPIIGSGYIDWMYKNRAYSLHFIISKHDCQSVLGKYACEEMSLVSRILTLDVKQYEDLFHGLGKLPGKYEIIIEEGVQPSVCPVRKIPIGVRDKLLAELQRMEQMGVIRKVNHPTSWVNAVVVAAKKDGDLRVCLDPRPLNRAVKRAHYPLPTLTEIATKLEGARYFSKLDARSGFWMQELTDTSADLCTFGTPFGRYQFLRLPYGINCASEVFHARVRQLLEDLEGVDSFVDDVIVWSRTLVEHDERLRLLLERARQVGIKFNKEKCEFRVQQVTYLGHTFSAKGMCIDKNKLKAIKDMPTPNDRPSLERFLGMVNYLSKFIPNYADVAAPLRCLLKKEAAWCWDEPAEAAVRRLKALVCSAPVLALYSVHEPVLLSVDASSRALGAVLMQAGRPVEFASCTLTETQCRYAQIEKELLAIVFGLERFHQYVFGRQDVLVETDHKPLEALFNKALDAVHARLQRMMLRIQGYEFKVTYTPGKYMYIADMLSRAPLPDRGNNKVVEEVEEQTCFLIDNVRFSDAKQRIIKEETGKDSDCQLIIGYIRNGWPEERQQMDVRVRYVWSYRESFEYVNGMIFKDNLVYIPRSLRPDMINKVHDGHLGVDRCKRHAREVMFWPGMSCDVERAVRRCAMCRERAPRPSREPLVPHEIPDVPWAKVGTDIFQHGKKYYLLLVDYFSNFIEVSPLSSIGSKTVIAVMKDQFARHGIPQQLMSDNGPAYASREFADFRKEWGFDHVTSSPNYAQSNGRSERSVRTIKNILGKSIASGSDFYLGLLNFRATPREGITSPSQLLMGRRLNTRLPIHQDKLRPYRDCRLDYENIKRNQTKAKSYYDVHSKALSELQPGEPVIMLDDDKRKYVRVEARADQPRSYFVKDSSGRRYRRNRRHLLKVESITPHVATDSASEVSPDTSRNVTSESEVWSSAENSDDSTYKVSDEENTMLESSIATLTPSEDGSLLNMGPIDTVDDLESDKVVTRLAAVKARKKIADAYLRKC